MIKRFYYFFTILFDSIPGVWKMTKAQYFDIGYFWTNDLKEYKEYKTIQKKISRIINPNL